MTGRRYLSLSLSVFLGNKNLLEAEISFTSDMLSVLIWWHENHPSRLLKKENTHNIFVY